MPSFRSEKKEFNYPKHKYSQKNKKPIINFKRHSEWNEKQESKVPTWLKISCKTETPHCMTDLCRELEQIIYRYNDVRTQLQAINPTFNDGRLDFYVKVSKDENKVLRKNYMNISRYDLKCDPHDSIKFPSVFPQNWLTVIMQALDKRFTKIDATNETEVNLSNFHHDTVLTQQGLVMELSNPLVMKCVFNVLKDTNLKEITKLNLSNNAISNIYQLELFFQHCSVLRVDLSDNRLHKPSDLKFMSKNAVIELNISNNDFGRKQTPRQLQDELRKIVPRLEILNGKRLPAAIVIAGESASTTAIKRTLPDLIWSDKTSDVYTDFVTKYCAAFDHETRDSLCEYYSSESVFSLSGYSSDIPNCYRSMNSNVLRSNSASAQIFKKGKAAIIGTFSGFPKTKHIETTLNEEIVFRTATDMMFVLSGVFIEASNKEGKGYRPRQFSRAMVIRQGQILQDHLTVLPSDTNLYHKFKRDIEDMKEQSNFCYKYRTELKDVSSEAAEIVRQFKVFSGMTVKACLEFLSFVGNLAEASTTFTEMNARGGIPKEAFEL